jgi:hypothetical protein
VVTKYQPVNRASGIDSNQAALRVSSMDGPLTMKVAFVRIARQVTVCPPFSCKRSPKLLMPGKEADPPPLRSRAENL